MLLYVHEVVNSRHAEDDDHHRHFEQATSVRLAKKPQEQTSDTRGMMRCVCGDGGTIYRGQDQHGIHI